MWQAWAVASMANTTLSTSNDDWLDHLPGSTSAFYIEDTLSMLCDRNGAHHALMEGGYYIQPGFTLLITVTILVLYVAALRFERLAELCWPRGLAGRAEGLLVAASALSYSDQRGLVGRINEAIPSTKDLFPEGHFVAVAMSIARRDADSRSEWCKCSWGRTESSSSASDDDDDDDEESLPPPVEPRSPQVDLVATLERREAARKELWACLVAKLTSEEAANLIVANLAVEDCEELARKLNPSAVSSSGSAALQCHGAEANDNAALGLSRHHEPEVLRGTRTVDASSEWLSWRDSAGDEDLEALVEEMKDWMESRHKIADRDVALIFLFVEVAVACWSLGEYYSFLFPQGHWFYCKIPYLLAVVSYKPFAIPMWACITICCPYTFAEFTFGHHPRGRDASGTCLASSIPRNVFSITLVFVITALLTVWVAIALLVFGPLLVAFCPVLVVPAFVTPFLAVYAPTKLLDCAVSRAGRRAKNKAKERRLKPGDRVEICLGSGDWRAGRIRALKDADGRPIVVPDVGGHLCGEEGAEWDRCRTETAKKFVIYGHYEETIFALRLAATQLIIAVTISLPLIQFYNGRYSYGDGAMEILGVAFNVPSLILQLEVSFYWPIFYVPQLQVQLVMGTCLVAIQCMIQGGQLIIRWTRSHPFVMLRAKLEGTHMERVLSTTFAIISWLPFRFAMDRIRSALEGAHLAAKRSSRQGGTDAPQSSAHTSRSQSCFEWTRTVMYCVGLFTCWFPIQATVSRKDLNIKAFPSNAQDKDLVKFCSGEGALWYSGICCDANANIGPILPWAHQLLWLKVLRITNCRNAEGNIVDICKWLVGLTHLEVGATPTSSSGAKSLVRLLTSTESHRRGTNAARLFEDDEDGATPLKLPWVKGNLSCLASLAHLLVVNLSMTSVEGDVGVLERCPAIRVVNLQGCTSVLGSVAVFRATPHLETCLLGSTLIQGDVAAFGTATRLSSLDLSFTKVGGSLAVLRCLPDLASLNLQRTSCEGSIEHAEATPKLASCVLDGARGVSGSVDVFRHTPSLAVLGLSETACHGNIRVFQFTPKMRVLRLAHAAVAANKASSSSRATAGTVVRRNQPAQYPHKVEGSIDVCKWTPLLRVLSLHATSCEGDIKVFQHTPRIKYLNLNGTRVHGDVLVFRFSKALTAVNLWRTRVHGNIEVFRSAKHLISLILAHSQVDGDKDALRAALPDCSTVLI